MTKLFARFVKDESGATAIEYGLIAGLIAVVIIAAVTGIGTQLKTKFEAIQTGLDASDVANVGADAVDHFFRQSRYACTVAA